MRNKIELSSDPDALFLNPWQDEGLKLLDRPKYFWRKMPAPTIDGFSVSVHSEINEKIKAFVADVNRHRKFKMAVEIASVPMLVEHASFRKSHLMAGEKLVLSGASGKRLLNSFCWEHTKGKDASHDVLNAYFEKCRKTNVGQRIRVEKTFIEPDLDFAIECRNTINYFHFITESLSQLCTLDDVGFQGNIYFHFPNQEEKHRNFVTAFVDALFPEYAGRVFFERTPKDYDLVLTAYDFSTGICQMPQIDLDKMSEIVPAGVTLGTIGFSKLLEMNSASSALSALRTRALKAIEGRDFSYLPKRFFVGRGDAQSRSRLLVGQDLLLEHLLRFGFEYVVFEDLEPLEQVAIMAQAEMMISHHGAGFTNMLFANPKAYVIELGTLQTAKKRWADFWPLATVSHCKYISFSADFNSEDSLQEPIFADDGIVPTAVSDLAAAQVMTFVVSVLGRVPNMPDAESLRVLVGRLLRARAFEQALTLLHQHEQLVI